MGHHFISAGTGMFAKVWSHVSGHHGFPGIAINELSPRHPKTRLYNIIIHYKYVVMVWVQVYNLVYQGRMTPSRF